MTASERIKKLEAALLEMHDAAEAALGIDQYGDCFQPAHPYAKWLRQACESARATLESTRSPVTRCNFCEEMVMGGDVLREHDCRSRR